MFMRPNNLVRLWSLGNAWAKSGAWVQQQQQQQSPGLGPWLSSQSFKSMPFIDKSNLERGAGRPTPSDPRDDGHAPSPGSRHNSRERGARRERDDSYYFPPRDREPDGSSVSSSSSSGSRRRDRTSASTIPLNCHITADIKHCKSIASLLEIIRNLGVHFNPLNVSAAVTQLASLSQAKGTLSQQPQQQHPDTAAAAPPAEGSPDISTMPKHMILHACLLLLARAAKPQILDFGPRQLSNCCWGAAKLVSTGAVKAWSAAPLTSIMLEQACKGHALNGATPTELSLLAWSASVMRSDDAELLQVLGTSALALPPAAFQDHEIINILTLFAAAKSRPPRLFPAFCTHLVESGRITDMAARHTQQLAFVCASAMYTDAALVSAVAVRAGQLLPQYRTRELCGLVASLTTLQCTDATVYQRACSRIETALRSGEPVEPLHVARMLFQESVACLSAGGRHGQRLVCSKGLVEAAMPALARSATLNEMSLAAVVLTAELVRGGGGAALQPLLTTLQALTPQLARMSHRSFQLHTDLVLALVSSLTHITSTLRERHAATANTTTTTGSSSSSSSLKEIQAGSQLDVATAFAAALRSVALSRLHDFSVDERAAMLKALVSAADSSLQA